MPGAPTGVTPGERGVGGVVTWDPGEQEGEGDHMEGVGVGSVQPQL